jgi:hypothetical protein
MCLSLFVRNRQRINLTDFGFVLKVKVAAASSRSFALSLRLEASATFWLEASATF